MQTGGGWQYADTVCRGAYMVCGGVCMKSVYIGTYSECRSECVHGECVNVNGKCLQVCRWRVHGGVCLGSICRSVWGVCM